MNGKLKVFLGGMLCVALGILGGAVPVVLQHEGVLAKIDPVKTLPLPNSDPDDILWAKKIIENQGKFILWFRHGEREKWTGTVTVFDHFDTSSQYGEFRNNWRPAVCLTPKGIAESQIMGKTLSVLKIRISSVVTSPSCRAKETALNAFGRFDYKWLEILHPTALTTQDQIKFKKILKSKLDNLIKKTNWAKGPIAVTGHGNTLQFYKDTLFKETEVDDWAVNELGFVVIEVTDQGLIARHSYVDFYEFANAVLEFK
jgi:broad specificity phosphatase PhoE